MFTIRFEADWGTAADFVNIGQMQITFVFEIDLLKKIHLWHRGDFYRTKKAHLSLFHSNVQIGEKLLNYVDCVKWIDENVSKMLPKNRLP